MHPADLIVETLTHAAPLLHNSDVQSAYKQLLKSIEVHLTGQPVFDGTHYPLTETQLVFIRYGLRSLSMAHRSHILASAEQLHESITRHNNGEKPVKTVIAHNDNTPAAKPQLRGSRGLNINTVIHKVMGGNVTFKGIEINSQSQVYNSGGYTEDDYLPVDPNDEPQEMAYVPPGMTHHVFLSYSRRDSRSMRRMKADLRAANLTVWTDETLTPGTTAWMHVVENAICAAGCVVILLSPDSVKSKWVANEITFAQHHNIPIIPVLSRGDETLSLPLSLSSYQWLDMRRDRDYRRNLTSLIKAVHKQIARTRNAVV
jgi:hypothetical protein